MITVHGLLGEPSPDLARAAAAADWVVGGSRHLDRLAVPEQRRITLGALSAAVTRIAAPGRTFAARAGGALNTISTRSGFVISAITPP